MKRLPLLTALIGASLSTTALAGHHSEAGFFKRDLNNDGVVSKVEYLKATESKFAKMDTNGDGVISKAEYQESRKKWKKPLYMTKNSSRYIQPTVDRVDCYQLIP